MAADLSVVVVAYRSSALLPEWRASLERASTGLSLEVILVENESGDEERRRVRSLQGFDRRIEMRGNRGYALAADAGVDVASAPRLLVSNPDVLFEPDAITRLVTTLDRLGGAVGPRLHFDPEAVWLLPPPSPDGTTEERRRLRSAFSARARRQRRCREADWIRTLRRSTAAFPVEALPGAVWMIGRDDWRQLSGLDPRFPLYWEETDFFRRARAAALPIHVDPAARVRHLFGRSGEGSEEARARFAISRRRYWRIHGSRWLRLEQLLLDRCAASPRGRERRFPPLADLAAPLAGKEGMDWLLSPSPDLVPAARADGGRSLSRGVQALATLLPAATWFLGLSSADGEMQPVGRFEAPGPNGQKTS